MLSFSNLSSAASQERRSIIERKSVNLPSSQASLETLLQSGSTSLNPVRFDLSIISFTLVCCCFVFMCMYV